METRLTRRTVAGLVLSLCARAASRSIGIMCNLPVEETGARKVLDAAREAGFRSIQVNFPWDRAGATFIHRLPRWIAASDLNAEVLSAYVNCAAPDVVIMSTRASDFDRAIDVAQAFGARRLIAWTGGHGSDLMAADPRNLEERAPDAICRFLEPRLARIEAAGLTLALETYITLVCPDAPSTKALLARLPPCVTAVLDPPNLTPPARYAARDQVLKEMVNLLAGRIGVVHLKDFRLKQDGRTYDLPGPLAGEMNYKLYASLVQGLPSPVPIIAEHLVPEQFKTAHDRLAPLFGAV